MYVIKQIVYVNIFGMSSLLEILKYQKRNMPVVVEIVVHSVF